MSFLQNLMNKQAKHRILNPVASPTPINLPEADSKVTGLSSSTREPFRVNLPLNSTYTPSNRRALEAPVHKLYRG